MNSNALTATIRGFEHELFAVDDKQPKSILIMKPFGPGYLDFFLVWSHAFKKIEQETPQWETFFCTSMDPKV